MYRIGKKEKRVFWGLVWDMQEMEGKATKDEKKHYNTLIIELMQ
jgi:hypothetical protein